MKSGRELDALIAEKVFGKKIDRSSHFDVYYENGPSIPFYSTNIADAWLVVEKLREKRIMLDINPQPDCYHVYVEQVCNEKGYKSLGDAVSETASLAICLAALKACGVEVE